jgi:hypothetical protein
VCTLEANIITSEKSRIEKIIIFKDLIKEAVEKNYLIISLLLSIRKDKVNNFY